MKGYRMAWEAARGEWLVFAPVALSAAQLDRIARWAEPYQLQRYRAALPGDTKDELRRSVEALKARRVACIVQNNEGTVFASTERTKPERAIFVMGGENHG